MVFSDIFLTVAGTSITYKEVPIVSTTMPTVLKIFKIQENLTYKVFFTFQNISKTTNVFKNCGHSFLSYNKQLCAKYQKHVIMST